MGGLVEDHGVGGREGIGGPLREGRFGGAGGIGVAGAGEVGPVGGHGLGELVVDALPGAVRVGQVVVGVGNFGGVEGTIFDEIGGGGGGDGESDRRRRGCFETGYWPSYSFGSPRAYRG